jgi:hypothetical protein
VNFTHEDEIREMKSERNVYVNVIHAEMRSEERNVYLNVTHEDYREMRSERNVYVNVTHEDERGDKCLCKCYT